MLQASSTAQPPENIALALKVLGNFDFSGQSIRHAPMSCVETSQDTP
jgi:hypothetical protein